MFHAPSLHVVLKARHLSGSTFYNLYGLGVLEQALDRIPLGFGIVVEDKPPKLSYTNHIVIFLLYKTPIELQCNYFGNYTVTSGPSGALGFGIVVEDKLSYTCY